MKIATNKVWNPTKDPKLSVWLAYNTNIVDDEGAVSSWTSSVAGTDISWEQETADDQPTKIASSPIYGVSFAGDEYLTGDQVTITGTFTIGIKFKILTATASNDVLVGDLTTAGHFIRVNDTNTVALKNGGGQKSIDVNGASVFTTNSYHDMVVSRNGSNLIEIWLNGVKQTNTNTMSGNFLLDGLGAREGVTNYFSGVIYEVIISTGQSDELSLQVSNHLKALRSS